jgi:hypothetical protein
MNAQDIEKALNKYAASDIRLTKKEGHMSVTDCKDGCVDVEYKDGTFTMVARKDFGRTLKTLLTNGTADQAKAVLVSQYVVEN